ncbi:MAG TPA: DUF4268 domain-containing protein [Polyangiaceae bacterium]|jgi:uncharacterized protein with ParB-like and HNH nuclease domain
MEAAEAKLQKVLEGSKQFQVPHYQRPYSWDSPQWQTLWRDVLELVDDPEAKPHFLGSIVTSPARSVPEGVEKRLVIDGQQRLTTLLVLLTVIRDRARAGNASKLADRVEDVITNRHEESLEFFKLLPTQAEDPLDSDREAFTRVVSSQAAATSRSGIAAAYEWFSKKLRRADAPDLHALHGVVTSKLTLVSIILDEKDNPHRIFESLNGKGRPLSQADLIRNFFFMRLPQSEHDAVYRDLWRPMQRRLGEDTLTDFVRHYLARFVGVTREDDVYATLKARVDGNAGKSPVEHLRELTQYSEYYDVLLHPEKAPSQALRDRLARINRLEVTVAYPFLLPVYAEFAVGSIDEMALRGALDLLENFVVRRFVCGVPTHGLNKIFAPLYEQAKKDGEFIAETKRLLSASPRAYPRDVDFRSSLSAARLYGAGERREKTKFFLERLEAAGGHKEAVIADTLTSEHVMPQTLTDVWKEELGPDWEEDHQQLLHTLGNLTLTSYNSELGNASYADKRTRYATSHIELNRHFAAVNRWNAESMERRAQVLGDVALAMWPFFGASTDADVHPSADLDDFSVAGTIPTAVRLRGVEHSVQSWVDVAVATIEAIVAMGDDELARIIEELPKFVNFDATAFRRSSRLRKLSNGVYVETNLSATTIYRLCKQAAGLAGLVADDWSVSYGGALDPDDEEEERASGNALGELRKEFWTEVRAALESTGAFPSLRPPPPRHWFVIALGRHGCNMSLNINTQKPRLAVKVVFRSEQATRVYEAIANHRAAIEAEVGAAFQWLPHPEKRWKTVMLTRPFDLHDRAAWASGLSWLAEYAVKVHRAFASRLATLPPDVFSVPDNSVLSTAGSLGTSNS